MKAALETALRSRCVEGRQAPQIEAYDVAIKLLPPSSTPDVFLIRVVRARQK
jgi:hypothetical protein